MTHSTNEPPIEVSTENTVETMLINPELVTETEQKVIVDPSYPDFCIPSPPPDLDSGEISQTRFRVTGYRRSSLKIIFQ